MSKNPTPAQVVQNIKRELNEGKTEKTDDTSAGAENKNGAREERNNVNDRNDRDRGFEGRRRGRGGFNRGGRGGSGNSRGPRDHSRDNDYKSEPKNEDMYDEDGMEEEVVEQPKGPKKFTGRCRLFVGNLPNDTTEESFRDMFKEFGELSECYCNTSRGFGFVRMDTRNNAEAAKQALDGKQTHNRTLRVRFAAHGAALKVKHLSPWVSNEMLDNAFGLFGQVERAIVIVDDRGKATGEGIIEFARKPGAQQALTRINEGCFFLGAALRPIMVEPLEQKDEEDGLPEKFLAHTSQYQKECEQGPRFASRGSFEYEFGMKWKNVYRMEEEQKVELTRQIEEQHVKLEMEMGAAQIEHQANVLRQEYLRKQEELKRMEEMHRSEMERRLAIRQQENEARQMQDERRREQEQRQEQMRQHQIDMRRQRHEQMMQAQEERAFGGGQERAFGGGGPGMYGGRGGQPAEEGGEQPAIMQPPPAPPAGMGIERGVRGPSQGDVAEGEVGGAQPEIESLMGMNPMSGGGQQQGGEPARGMGQRMSMGGGQRRRGPPQQYEGNEEKRRRY